MVNTDRGGSLLNSQNFIASNRFLISQQVDAVLFLILFCFACTLHVYRYIQTQSNCHILLICSACIEIIASVAVLAGSISHNGPLALVSLPAGIFATWLIQAVLVHLLLQWNHSVREIIGKKTALIHHFGTVALGLLSIANSVLLAKFTLLYTYSLAIDVKEFTIFILLYRIGYGLRLVVEILLCCVSMGLALVVFSRRLPMPASKYQQASILIFTYLLLLIADFCNILLFHSISSMAIAVVLIVAAFPRKMLVRCEVVEIDSASKEMEFVCVEE
ncbi:hypothetical protein BDF19DRAFT_29875 [Syncephalis fuscata]|nr:hypothetical protein BDF19DRAFT_29875 [Syncephalis fuscata]